MVTRLTRLMVGILLLATLIFTIIPSLLIWVVTGRQYLEELAQWVVTEEVQ
jgi:hypothetical protein